MTEVFRNPQPNGYADQLSVPATTPLESTSLPGFTFHLASALAQ